MRFFYPNYPHIKNNGQKKFIFHKLLKINKRNGKSDNYFDTELGKKNHVSV